MGKNQRVVALPGQDFVANSCKMSYAISKSFLVIPKALTTASCAKPTVSLLPFGGLGADKGGGTGGTMLFAFVKVVVVVVGVVVVVVVVVVAQNSF
ncbi:hypothetical protein M0802_005740 [Mischocyttarus mexicanus]|nr:hypothetical protein M0802_005740 [Mischocyttarus mexicanus]